MPFRRQKHRVMFTFYFLFFYLYSPIYSIIHLLINDAFIYSTFLRYLDNNYTQPQIIGLLHINKSLPNVRHKVVNKMLQVLW